MSLEEKKKWADFAITPFYQQHFKPYLKHLEDNALLDLRNEPEKEFDSLKRDVKLWAIRDTISKIQAKVDQAPKAMEKAMNKQLDINIKKL